MNHTIYLIVIIINNHKPIKGIIVHGLCTWLKLITKVWMLTWNEVSLGLLALAIISITENRRIRWDTKSPRNDATWWDHRDHRDIFRTFWNNCNSKKPTLARLGNHRTPTRAYPLTQSFPLPPWCRPRPRHIERPQPAGFWYKGGASQSENFLLGWFPMLS